MVIWYRSADILFWQLSIDHLTNWLPFFMRLSCYDRDFRHNIVKVAVDNWQFYDEMHCQ